MVILARCRPKNHMSIRTLLSALFIFLFISGFAQETLVEEAGKTNETEDTEKEPKVKKPKPPYYHHKLPSIQINGGNVSLMSDDMDKIGPSSGANWRWGYGAKVEYRPLNYLGASLGVMLGKVANQQRTGNEFNNYTVETDILSAEFNIIIPLDNNVIINRASKFAPYLFGGVAYQWFNTQADDFSSDGSYYHYWRDGSFRNRIEDSENPQLGEEVSHDRNYETPLREGYGDSVRYDRTQLAFPFGVGFRWKFSNSFYADLSATYYWGLSDYLDNYKSTEGTQTDHMLYTAVGFGYNIGARKKQPDSSQFDLIDFDALDNEDDDGDGVRNMEDLCAGTPQGTGVDDKGCPTDEDKDGIPDYIDDEAGTAEGALVDAKGVTIGDEIPGTDTLAVKHSVVYLAYPSQKFRPMGTVYSTESVEQAGKRSTDLGDFKDADYNDDGYISSDEITLAIDDFFEGELDYSADKLHDLIDFFFDQ
ncbi:MAG: hypothetical protein ACI9FU_000786 [Granulosicoccus sp.]|jgi:hypothetical protein